MSYLGNLGSRFNRASTACIAALPSEIPLSYTFWLSSTTGCSPFHGREAHVGVTWANQAVVFWESLEGLEVRHQGQCVAVLREYRTFRQMLPYRVEQIPPVLSFEPCEQDICPRNAVA